MAQIQQGAPADVLATPDTKTMDKVGDLTVPPRPSRGTSSTIAVAGNPESITGFADLSRKGLKVVLAAPEVPVGKYSQEVLGTAGVTVKPVSLRSGSRAS